MHHEEAYEELYANKEEGKKQQRCKASYDHCHMGVKNPSRDNPGIDMINHPNHYKTETGLETIDVIEAFTSDLNGIEAVCTGNVVMCLSIYVVGIRKMVLKI